MSPSRPPPRRRGHPLLTVLKRPSWLNFPIRSISVATSSGVSELRSTRGNGQPGTAVGAPRPSGTGGRSPLLEPLRRARAGLAAARARGARPGRPARGRGRRRLRRPACGALPHATSSRRGSSLRSSPASSAASAGCSPTSAAQRCSRSHPCSPPPAPTRPPIARSSGCSVRGSSRSPRFTIRTIWLQVEAGGGGGGFFLCVCVCLRGLVPQVPSRAAQAFSIGQLALATPLVLRRPRWRARLHRLRRRPRWLASPRRS